MVTTATDLADRIEVWLKQEHVLNRVLPDTTEGLPISDVVLVVLPKQADQPDPFAAVIRQQLDRTSLLVTGESDRCPQWLEAIATTHRSVLPVFPASPAALQVAARSLIHQA